MKHRIAKMRRLCKSLELEGADILDRYTDDQLAEIYNGIGPDSFPKWLVGLLDHTSPSMGPACMLHDVEWHESDGTKKTFTATNERLVKNGRIIARKLYEWYNPRRYAVKLDAWILGTACQQWGWPIYKDYGKPFGMMLRP